MSPTITSVTESTIPKPIRYQSTVVQHLASTVRRSCTKTIDINRDISLLPNTSSTARSATDIDIRASRSGPKPGQPTQILSYKPRPHILIPRPTKQQHQPSKLQYLAAPIHGHSTLALRLTSPIVTNRHTLGIIEPRHTRRATDADTDADTDANRPPTLALDTVEPAALIPHTMLSTTDERK